MGGVKSIKLIITHKYIQNICLLQLFYCKICKLKYNILMSLSSQSLISFFSDGQFDSFASG